MSANCIDEKVSHVYLVLLQIESGCGFIVLDRECDLAIVIDGADMAAEFPSMTTVAWCGELDLADDPDSVPDFIAIDQEGYLQVVAVEDCRRYQFKAHDRKVR